MILRPAAAANAKGADHSCRGAPPARPRMVTAIDRRQARHGRPLPRQPRHHGRPAARRRAVPPRRARDFQASTTPPGAARSGRSPPVPGQPRVRRGRERRRLLRLLRLARRHRQGATTASTSASWHLIALNPTARMSALLRRLARRRRGSRTTSRPPTRARSPTGIIPLHSGVIGNVCRLERSGTTLYVAHADACLNGH